jgi:hypothetical protein
MGHSGIDVHKRESQIYILAEGGKVVEQRIRTEPARFATVFQQGFCRRVRRKIPSVARFPGGQAADRAPVGTASMSLGRTTVAAIERQTCER